MKITDFFLLGLENLWKTKIRSVLTILGVAIGIGALVSMMSFGAGVQKNLEENFYKNDVFTTFRIFPGNFNPQELMQGQLPEKDSSKTITLSDSALLEFKKLENIALIFPETNFPGKVNVHGQDASTLVQCVPSEVGKYKPYSQLLAGTFLTGDSARQIALSTRFLKKCKIHLTDLGPTPDTSFLSLPSDSLIGKSVELITAVINPFDLLSPYIKIVSSKHSENDHMKFREKITQLTVCGIINEESMMGRIGLQGDVYIPIHLANEIPRFNFTSIWDILNNPEEKNPYQSFYGRADRMENLDQIKEKAKTLGLNFFSFASYFEEIKKQFLVFDAFLGAIGLIALVVAALGIINTMLMSILERTREIGIMKSVGASNFQVKLIFFSEAVCIGIAGAILGLFLGWMVTLLTNQLMLSYIQDLKGQDISFFYFPPWLIIGATAFSIIISLLAGMYPANRAAKIEPVKALRHD